MTIKVGQIWVKDGPEWSSGAEGAPVVIISVKGNDVQYRYLRMSDQEHGYSGEWTKDTFLRAFKLQTDVI